MGGEQGEVNGGALRWRGQVGPGLICMYGLPNAVSNQVRRLTGGVTTQKGAVL